MKNALARQIRPLLAPFEANPQDNGVDYVAVGSAVALGGVTYYYLRTRKPEMSPIRKAVAASAATVVAYFGVHYARNS
jgi:hypothetical protein